jgi:hypothetical protein
MTYSNTSVEDCPRDAVRQGRGLGRVHVPHHEGHVLRARVDVHRSHVHGAITAEVGNVGHHNRGRLDQPILEKELLLEMWRQSACVGLDDPRRLHATSRMVHRK